MPAQARWSWALRPLDLPQIEDLDCSVSLNELIEQLERARTQSEFIGDDRSVQICREVARNLRRLTVNYRAQLVQLCGTVSATYEAGADRYCDAMDARIAELQHGESGEEALPQQENVTYLTKRRSE